MSLFGPQVRRGNENVQWPTCCHSRTAIQTDYSDAYSKHSHHKRVHTHHDHLISPAGWCSSIRINFAASCISLASSCGPFCSSCSSVTVTWNSASHAAPTQRKEHGPCQGWAPCRLCPSTGPSLLVVFKARIIGWCAQWVRVTFSLSAPIAVTYWGPVKHLRPSAES